MLCCSSVFDYDSLISRFCFNPQYLFQGASVAVASVIMLCCAFVFLLDVIGRFGVRIQCSLQCWGSVLCFGAVLLVFRQPPESTGSQSEDAPNIYQPP